MLIQGKTENEENNTSFSASVNQGDYECNLNFSIHKTLYFLNLTNYVLYINVLN